MRLIFALASAKRFRDDLPESLSGNIQAGKQAGVRTGFINRRRCDSCRVVGDLELQPDFWGENLGRFVEHVLALEL